MSHTDTQIITGPQTTFDIYTGWLDEQFAGLHTLAAEIAQERKAEARLPRQNLKEKLHVSGRR